MLDIKDILSIVSNTSLGITYIRGITRAFILLKEEAEDTLEDLLNCQTSQLPNLEEE